MTDVDYLRTAEQWSEPCIAGLTTPPTVFAAQVNQATFASYDKIASVPWSDATTGAWGDVIVGQTLWVGDTLGGRERGEVRVRSITATDIGIGESSDIEWADDLYLTVKDEMLLWPRHVRIASNVVYMDYNVAYSDQHSSFDPVPVMGPDAVVEMDLTEKVLNGTFATTTDNWTAGTGVLLTVAFAAMHIDRNGAGVIDHAWQNVTTVIGKKYKVVVNIVSYSHQYEVYVGGVLLFDYAQGTGTKTYYFTATGTTTKIAFRATNDAAATLNVDDVSFQRVETVTFPEGGDSWVIGSTIASHAWTATAGIWDDATSATPTLTIIAYPTDGQIRISDTVTATTTGKTTTGYRYIYVFDAEHPPMTEFEVGPVSGDYDSGGCSFEVTMVGDISTVRDRAKVILFARDRYGTTQVSLGRVTGRENIVAIGYVDGESLTYNDEKSSDTFTVQGPQFWLGKMSGFPPGVEIRGVASWTRILGLTVDKALWHLLHWRATATAVMDVRLSGDTRIASAFEVPTESIWAQMIEIAATSIFANPGCNRLGQLFVEIEPNLVPEADRTWDTVMDITKVDWEGEITMLCKCDVPEVSMLASSGVSVNNSGVGTPYFSLSPGHVFHHYGDIEINDRLLLESQTQSNTLAGLIAGWRNNNYPSFDIVFASNNRLLDLFPRTFCTITLAAGDTIRGRAYSGNLILRSYSLDFDPDTGFWQTNTNFEGESFPELSTNGDPPPGGGGDGGGGGSGDCEQTTCPDGYYLDENHCCIPDGGGGTIPGASTIAILTNLNGMVYTTNFDAVNPDDVLWTYYNEGLDATDLTKANDLFLTPDGHVYIVSYQAGYEFIAVAPSLGEPFVKLIDAAWLVSTYPGTPDGFIKRGLAAFNINPNVGNYYAFIAGITDLSSHTGTNDIYYNSLTPTNMAIVQDVSHHGSLTFGNGNWTNTAKNAAIPSSQLIIMQDPFSSVVSTGILVNGSDQTHWRLGDELYCVENGYDGYNSYLFTGDGTDIAEWTFNLYGGAGRTQLASDPTGQSIMAVGAPVGGGTEGLYLSTDAGATWTEVTTAEASEYGLVLANGFGADIWVAVREELHIWFSSDAGTTWENRAGNMAAGLESYVFPVWSAIQVRVGYNAPSQ